MGDRRDNGRAIYQSLLAQTDTEARDDYEYDPRVQMYMNRRDGEGDAVARQPAYNPDGEIDQQQENIADLARNHNEELVIQDFPSTVAKTQTILINTGYRDWTVQPDAYSNVFSFGDEKNIDLNGPQIPYYYNNVVIPLIAYETPTSAVVVGAGARNTYITPANTARQTFDTLNGARIPPYFRTSSQTYQPTYGWKIVTSNGVPLHTPTAFSYTDPNVQVTYYPTYDAADTRGAMVGIDIQPKLYGTSLYNYSTSKRFSNVSSIRLIRAMLPVRANQPWNPDIFTDYVGVPMPLIYQDSFHNKAYSFMNIGNLNGAQYGGAQAVQRSFATLTQTARTLYEPQSRHPSQYFDVYPWESEAYTFDPPMHELSNAYLQLVDEVGVPYSQLDNLNVIGMKILNGSNFGKVQFFISTNSLSLTTLGDANVFYGNDLRVGDEIIFYRPAVSQIASDPVAGSSALGSFLQTFSNNYIITDVSRNDFLTTAILPTSFYATSFNAVPKIQTSSMGALYATLSSLVNSSNSNIYLRSYVDPVTTNPSGPTLSQQYVMPMLNKCLQATFALEIITQEPDASKITKMIPAVE